MKKLHHLFILCTAILYSALFFGITQNANAQDPIFGWAKSMGGTSSDISESITTDASGNVYVTGRYQGTADFDPSGATFNLTANAQTDIFIQKLDPNGNFIWAKSIGGAAGDNGYCITTDASGNVYVTGTYFGTVDFDPSGATFNLTSTGPFNGSFDVFVLKLDAGGNFVWAKSMGGTSSDYGRSITTDASGNVYVTGFYQGTVDFDPSGAIFNLTANGFSDVFIQKLDALGNFIWAKSVGGVSEDQGYSIITDDSGNVYIAGYYSDTTDFDPGVDTFNLTSNGSRDIFIQKLDALGNFIWAKSMGGTNVDKGRSISTDASGNVYVTGNYYGTSDFDPGVDSFNLTSSGQSDVFIQKLDAFGNFIWAKSMGGTSYDYGKSITADASGHVYVTGFYKDTADFDPSASTFNLISSGLDDVFIQKLDAMGNFIWAKSMGGTGGDRGNSIRTDASGHVYVTGFYENMVNFDPSGGTFNLIATGLNEVFVIELQQPGVTGFVFNDISVNCIRDTNEIGLSGRTLTINPGNIVVQTDTRGNWFIDSLPANTYTITADTSGKWQLTCPVSQTFTVTDPNGLTYAPSFGFVSTAPCASPNVSIHAPFLRRCFSNQKVYVQACNQNLATGVLDSAYVEVQLDPLFMVQSATLPYTLLGDNTYRFDVGTLNPGVCASFSISCALSCSAVPSQTLCIQADLYPADSCVFDTLPDTTVTGISPCTLPWDKSSLMVEGSCVNDSVRFVVYNTGDPITGDMTCFSAVRLYIDGQFILLDSVLLAGGDSAVFIFSGDGRTWRLEADQHPLHPGNSHPNTTVELCGNNNNWTPDLINLLPLDDADPVTDIYCGLVTGSYDPNDKTGYPLGVTDSNHIVPNQELQYVIRFQNTGTDTAFTVVIRDTLTTDLDIFSVTSGATSHNYTFRMYGPRVLEWTFDNILLPDSNTNEPQSNGFITFTVAQNPNLPNGTVIQNAADIYFDFNAPVITNETLHRINDGLKIPQLAGQTMVTDTACGTYTLNGITYTTSGTYMQSMVSSGGLDSILTLNLTIINGIGSAATISQIACESYTVPSGDETYTISGTYADTIPNIAGCDSILTLNLTILNSTNASISPIACSSYTVPSGDEIYTVSGTYIDTIPNMAGCDSLLTINLTINPVPVVSISGLDSSYCSTETGVTMTGIPAGGTFSGTGAVAGNQFFPATGADTYLVTYAYTDSSGCSTSISQQVSVNICTSVQQLELNANLEVYPNPNSGIFTIKFNAEVTGPIALTIIDNLGREIYKENIDSFKGTFEKQLDLSRYPAGIYSLQLTTANGVVIHQVVIE